MAQGAGILKFSYSYVQLSDECGDVLNRIESRQPQPSGVAKASKPLELAPARLVMSASTLTRVGLGSAHHCRNTHSAASCSSK